MPTQDLYELGYVDGFYNLPAMVDEQEYLEGYDQGAQDCAYLRANQNSFVEI